MTMMCYSTFLLYIGTVCLSKGVDSYYAYNPIDGAIDKLSDIADQCIDVHRLSFLDGFEVDPIVGTLAKLDNQCMGTQASKFESALLDYWV